MKNDDMLDEQLHHQQPYNQFEQQCHYGGQDVGGYDEQQYEQQYANQAAAEAEEDEAEAYDPSNPQGRTPIMRIPPPTSKLEEIK